MTSVVYLQIEARGEGGDIVLYVYGLPKTFIKYISSEPVPSSPGLKPNMFSKALAMRPIQFDPEGG